MAGYLACDPVKASFDPQRLCDAQVESHCLKCRYYKHTLYVVLKELIELLYLKKKTCTKKGMPVVVGETLVTT